VFVIAEASPIPVAVVAAGVETAEPGVWEDAGVLTGEHPAIRSAVAIPIPVNAIFFMREQSS